MPGIFVLCGHFSQAVQLLYQGSCPLVYEMRDKLHQVFFMKWDEIKFSLQFSKNPTILSTESLQCQPLQNLCSLNKPVAKAVAKEDIVML